MIWVMLAAFLTRKPPLVQAIVLGVCTGLFASAAGKSNDRDPAMGSVMLLALVIATIAGALFYWGLVYQRQRGWTPENPAPRWLYAVYATVWVMALLAGLLALFGDAGLKVAVLTIVPLVLLAPTSIHGIRLLLHREAA